MAKNKDNKKKSPGNPAADNAQQNCPGNVNPNGAAAPSAKKNKDNWQ